MNAFRASDCARVVAASTRGARRAGQRGLALIIAMLIAALAAAVAVSLASSQAQWSARVYHQRDHVQAQSIAQAGVQWARQILDADAHAGTIDYLGEPWALPLPATPLENGSVEGRIIDAQGLFNVNNLASPTRATFERNRFERLFTMLNLPQATRAAIIDWVDADNVPEPDGAEDTWYVAQREPGLAANGPAVRFEELSGVRGMTPATMASLARYATSLPVDTPLNVNTAPIELLAASMNVDPASLAPLVASRAAHPFASLPDFRERLPPDTPMGNEAGYAVSSQYFLVTVRARQGDTVAQARALIHRSGAGWPDVMWQTIE